MKDLIESLDLPYVWQVGEDIRARLFPVPKADGRQPYPLPVEVHYQPAEGVDIHILFLPERTIQRVDEAVEHVLVSAVRVFWGELGLGTIDLAFGKEPSCYALDGNEEPDALAVMALLRAVAGVL